jgi:cell division septation protein DedD
MNRRGALIFRKFQWEKEDRERRPCEHASGRPAEDELAHSKPSARIPRYCRAGAIRGRPSCRRRAAAERRAASGITSRSCRHLDLPQCIKTFRCHAAFGRVTVAFRSTPMRLVRRRFGVEERSVSMPLLRYFATIGAILTALLLLFDFMLAPNKPERFRHPIAGVETEIAQPRTTSGSAPMPAATVPGEPVTESRDKPAETTAATSVPPAQPQPSLQADPRSPARARSRSKPKQRHAKDRKIDAVGRPFSDGSAYGYSREKSVPAYSPEGTMGPH